MAVIYRQQLVYPRLLLAVFSGALLIACDSREPVNSSSVTVATQPAAESPQTTQVRQAVTWAQQLVNSTATSDMAAASLASMAEAGGDITTYILASVPDGGFTCYSSQRDAKPFCVRVSSGSSDGEYILEGYGENTDKPVVQLSARAVWPR